MDVRHRQRDDEEEQHPLVGNVTVEVAKGAGGMRSVVMPRARLYGLSHGQVVQAFAQELDDGDAFADDVITLLGNRSYSLEYVESGRQTRWVDRDAPVEEAVVEQERLRYALSRDHHGGR